MNYICGKRLAPGESVAKVGTIRELAWGPPSDSDEALRERVELLRQRRVPPRKAVSKPKKSAFEKLSKAQQQALNELQQVGETKARKATLDALVKGGFLDESYKPIFVEAQI